MSTAKTIIDTIKTQFAGITGVGLVTEDIAVWNGSAEESYNRLFLRPTITASDWVEYPDSTEPDRQYEMTLLVEGVVSTMYPDDIAAMLDTLQNNVEIELLTNSAITTLVDSVNLRRFEKDAGLDEAYGIFNSEFMIEYTANHNSP